MTQPVTVVMPDEMLAWLDRERGLVKKSTFIVDLLSRFMISGRGYVCKCGTVMDKDKELWRCRNCGQTITENTIE